jgi:uncharacterized coiled-coil DUF342 family protein
METLNQEQRERVAEFLKGLDISIDILDYVSPENIDIENAYESILEALQENGGFNVEIIYYSNAIKFLQENDSSLKESLEIASEFGFSIDSLSSELLASLLASRQAEEEFYELQSEIDDFFQDLCDELEEEIED